MDKYRVPRDGGGRWICYARDIQDADRYGRLSNYTPSPSLTRDRCRECSASTLPTCGNRRARCWRWELTKRRLARITRMVGAGR